MIGLPSLWSLDQGSCVRIWLATSPADMRCGFDRLAQMAASVTGDSPLSGHLFLFRGRGGDRLKMLYWDRDGFALWYKRLEEGVFWGDLGFLGERVASDAAKWGGMYKRGNGVVGGRGNPRMAIRGLCGGGEYSCLL